jgi:hypothetical protein
MSFFNLEQIRSMCLTDAGDRVLSVARGILEMMEPMSARCALMRAGGSATNPRYRIVTQSIPANE